jgi:hypothetical protein
MRRVHELGIPVLQIGARAYSSEERLYRQENNANLGFSTPATSIAMARAA